MFVSRAALALLALSAVVWSITFCVEVFRDTDRYRDSSEVQEASEDGDLLLRSDVASETQQSALSELLPSALDGWIVQGIQPVPGSGGVVLEGNYTPRDEKRSLVMPLVVYVQVASVDAGRVQEAPRKALESRYTEAHAEYVIEGVEVRSGRTPDGGSYFVTWESTGNVYGVDATFRFRIPASGGHPVLQSAADEIAKAIIRHKPGQGGVE